MRNNTLGIDLQKFTDASTAVKSDLENVIAALQTLRQVTKQFDGKMFNKRIFEAITATKKFYAYKTDSGSFHVSFSDIRLCEHSRHWYIYDSLTISAKETAADPIVINRRFNHANYDKHIRDRIQQYRQYIAEIDKDLLDAQERLQEAEQAARYYLQLVQSFSGFAKSKYQQNFTIQSFRF